MPAVPVEIERKFYLAGPPPFLAKLKPVPIRQGYLAIEKDGNEVRIRDREGMYWLTVKSPGAVERTEVEFALSPVDFDRLWPLTLGRRVTKERFLHSEQGYQVEIDRYREALEGLYTAEVEFSSREAARDFVIPGWMGIEITENPHFKNKSLAALPGFDAVISFL